MAHLEISCEVFGGRPWTERIRRSQQRMHVDGIEARNDDIGAGGAELVRILMTRDADTIHASGFRCLDSHRRVLNDKALARRHPERLCGGKKECRIGLAARHIEAIHVRVQQIEECRLRVDERVVQPLARAERSNRYPFEEVIGILG